MSCPGALFIQCFGWAYVVTRIRGGADCYKFMQHDDAVRMDINEAFLLHGVPKATLMEVLTNGLNEKFSGGQ